MKGKIFLVLCSAFALAGVVSSISYDNSDVIIVQGKDHKEQLKKSMDLSLMAAPGTLKPYSLDADLYPEPIVVNAVEYQRPNDQRLLAVVSKQYITAKMNSPPARPPNNL